MRASKFPFFFLACLVSSLLAAAGCYQPGGPVPEPGKPPAERAWTTEDVDSVVAMTMEEIYSPAPRDNGNPPPECDYIHFLRFRCREAPDDPSGADFILVMIPGFMGGANSLEYFGRQLVYMARTFHGKRAEVWVMDRRPNNLEDLTGLNAAEKAGDIQVAIDYYYHGLEIDGRKFEGFLGDRDVPFLSEFGLALAMQDVYRVITTMVPDPLARRRKVFVGGHSLGGPLAAYFAGWDFDGNPETLEDAGFMNCAGLVGLDTVLQTSLPVAGFDALPVLFGIPPVEDAEGYRKAVEGMREGIYPRIVPLPLMYPEFLALHEMMAMEAAWHPDDESTLLRRIPISPEVDMVLRCLQARAWDHFALPIPYMTDFRYTNEAQFGLMVDDNFQPETALQASCGFLAGGAVVPKGFPVPEDYQKIPGLDELLRPLTSIRGIYVANDAGPSCCALGQGPLYTWVNFDQVGDATDPDYTDTEGTMTYTTAVEEVSDIQDVARAMFIGPTNALEWYFALRVNLDMMVADREIGPACGLFYLHGDRARELPHITFTAEKGPFVPSGAERVLRGYNHIDVCMAAADRPSRRENEVLSPTIQFILSRLEER